MQSLSVSTVRLVSSLTVFAALAAGCGSGSIGETKPEPDEFTPAAAPIDASTTRESDTNASPPPEEIDVVDSSGRSAPDSSAADTAASVDTAVAVDSATSVDTAVAVDTAPSVDTAVAPDTAKIDTGTAPDTSVADTAIPVGSAPPLVWRKANLTWYTSYPEPGSAECIDYSGCEWAGQFAALSSKMPESWVKANNIAAVHGKDFETYKLKTLRLRQGTKQIDVKVYDMCADSDCSGCCTKNSSTTGFLIDIEKYTAERFGTSSGIVEWTCLDCAP